MTASPATYRAQSRVPENAADAAQLLEAARRRLSSEVSGVSALPRDLARFLGANSAAWSHQNRVKLRTLLASIGEAGIAAALAAVAERPRADVGDDAAEVLRLAVRRWPTLVGALEQRFDSARSPVRATIVRGIASFDVARALIVKALGDDDPEVRDAAAQALGRADASVRAILERQLGKEQHAIVRESIQMALDELDAP